MQINDYPCYYIDADYDSSYYQSKFFNILILEYMTMVLILIGVITKSVEIVLVFFLCSLALLTAKIVRKYDRLWYRRRAHAESLKTMTWRWMMSDNTLDEPWFLNQINNYTKRSNILLSEKCCHTDSITLKMREIKKLSINEKFDIYRNLRITNQEIWYKEKISLNKKDLRKNYFILGIFYTLVIVYLITSLKLGNTNFNVYDSSVVLISITTSWINSKKFNELIEAYQITLSDIVILKNEIMTINQVEDFQKYVENCENAFSREHTQWYARKSE